MRKVLLSAFFVVLLVALVYKSPFSATYNFDRAKGLYNQGKYAQAIPYFERSLFANPNSVAARNLYLIALSKVSPTYSVQKAIYEIAQSKIDDSAKKYAQMKVKSIKYKLLDGIDNNYIYNAASGKDIIRWDIKKFPLRVYIDTNGVNIPQYYVTEIISAMKQWEARTNFVKFTQYDQDASTADIVIYFTNDEKICDDKSDCRFSVAHTNPDIGKNNILKTMTIGFHIKNPKNEYFTPKQIYSAAIHETGHALGIMGHSDNPTDVMYPIQNTDDDYELPKLSPRDLKTLVLLYRTKPTISNVKNLNSESFYYAPLVIGDEDVLIFKKIEELKRYINDYPNIASGYINLGSTYADIGDFETALKYMQTAEDMALSQEDRYVINYNRAILYYNMQDIEKALEYSRQAKSIRDDKSINDLIEEIQKFGVKK